MVDERVASLAGQRAAQTVWWWAASWVEKTAAALVFSMAEKSADLWDERRAGLMVLQMVALKVVLTVEC